MSRTEIRKQAQHYLEKHQVPVERFGLGPCIDEGRATLIPDLQLAFSGAALIRLSDERPFPDCARVAYALWKDINENEPGMNPRIAAYNGNTHFWVEIRGGWRGNIQIDASPWYRCLEPGHKGGQWIEPALLTGNGPASETTCAEYMVESDRGLVFSVVGNGRDWITTTLRGWWPRAAQIGPALLLAPDTAPELPDIRLTLLIKDKEPVMAAEKVAWLLIHLDIMDNRAIAALQQESIDELMRNQWIGLSASIGRGQTLGFQSMQGIEEIVGRGFGSAGVAEIRRNLGRVKKLLGTMLQFDSHGGDNL